MALVASWILCRYVVPSSRREWGRADLVLRPLFRRDIDTPDFGARRECVAAGIRTVRAEIETIRRVLAP